MSQTKEDRQISILKKVITGLMKEQKEREKKKKKTWNLAVSSIKYANSLVDTCLSQSKLYVIWIKQCCKTLKNVKSNGSLGMALP